MLLLIDNYDSFTFNLAQLLGELGADPVVIRNDQHSVAELVAMGPERVVVSPGPCTPSEAGVSVELVRVLAGRAPLLGVCLGHQSIGEAFGGHTVRARRVMHGKTAPVRHTRDGLFAGVPSPFEVARYHSLITEDPLPESLVAVAWSDEDGEEEVQGLRHREHAVWGVQFHPESHFSSYGKRILLNFLEL